jgi:hypothetical protein
MILFVLTIFNINGQVTERYRLIQVNGIITDETNSPVPHVSIISKKLKRGTISELTGIYSLISLPGDTVFISALGFKNMELYVPRQIEGRQYKRDITLETDTIVIEGVNILPWKTYEEFKRDVIANIPVEKPEIRNMYENLASIQYTIANTQSYRASPEAGYRMAMQQNTGSFVARSQAPVNNLLNPFAWAKFFSGLKHGLLKNKKFPKPDTTKPNKKKK